MANHLTPQQVQNYRQRAMDADERLHISEHLYACDECRRLVKSGMALTTLAANLQATIEDRAVDEHLTAEEMTAFVAEKIDPEDRRFVRDHIAGCAVCAHQIKELEQFRNTLSAYPPEAYAPVIRQSPYQLLLSRLRSYDRRMVLPALGSMAAGGLAVFVFVQRHPAAPGPIDPAATPQFRQLTAKLAQAEAAVRQNNVQSQHLAQQLAQQEARQEQEQAVARQDSARLRGALERAEKQAARTPPQLIALLQQLTFDRSPADLLISTDALRSSGEGPIAPMGTCICATRPRFSWAEVDGAASYEVIIKDKLGHTIDSFSAGSALAGTSARDLPQGQILTWLVSAKIPLQPDRVSSPARFRILSTKEIRALEEDISLLKRMPGDADTAVMTGKVLWHYGLLDEAQQTFAQAAPANSKARGSFTQIAADATGAGLTVSTGDVKIIGDVKMWKGKVATLYCAVAFWIGIGITPACSQNAPSNESAQTPTHSLGQQEFKRLSDSGAEAWHRGDLSAAVSAYQEALKRAQELKDDQGAATCLTILGNIYTRLRQFDKAINYLQQALEIDQKIGTQQDIAKDLSLMGTAYKGLEQFDKSIDFLQRALQIRQQLGNPQDIALNLTILGRIYFSLGQLDKALDYLQRALDIDQKVGSQRDIAFDLTLLGNVASRLKLYDSAINYLQRALDIDRKSGSQEDVALDLSVLGAAYKDQGQFDKAIDFLQRALEIRQKFANRHDIAIDLTVLGAAYMNVGQFDKALDSLQRALEIEESTDHQQITAEILTALGNTYERVGQFDTALFDLQRALEIEERLGKQQDIARVLSALGAAYKSLGQFDKTINYLQRALDIDRMIGSQEDIAKDLSILGSAYMELDQFDKATGCLQGALEIRQKLANQQDIAIDLTILGHVYSRLGQFDKSINYLQRALAIDQKIGNQEDIATDLSILGATYRALGQYDKAIGCLEHALEIRQKLANQQDITSDLTLLGKAYFRLNQFEKAARYYARALISYEQFSHQAVSPTTLGDLQQAMGNLYADYALLLMKQNRYEDALVCVERGRAQGLARQIAINGANLARLFTPEEARQLKAVSTQRSIASRRLLAAQSRHGTADQTRHALLTKQLQTAEHEYEWVRDRLSIKYPQFRQIEGKRPPAAADLMDLAHHHPDTLYLEYVVVDGKTTLLFALMDGIVKPFLLPIGENTLARQTQNWRVELMARSEAEPGYARQLYTGLMGKVEKAGLLSRAQHIVIVADGPLLDLPFSVLIDSGGRRLLQRLPLSSALSLGTLLWNENPRKPSASLLCAADPLGELEQPQNRSYRRGGYGPLKEARDEGRAIAALFPGAALFLGPDAREAQIEAQMSNYAILHFATHGYLDTRNGMRSGLILAREPDSSALDGVLDAQEIVETGVTAHLTVLSACQTAQGQRSEGEGLLGLVWAFRAAGCPAVVASEWEVADVATKDLMVAFYQQLKAGKRKDDALRTAMLAIKSRRPQPFYWAAFQIIGDTAPLSL